MSDSRMRCSECKFIKMCVFNPEGKDGDPESFGCFYSHKSAGIQKGVAKPTTSGVKIAGTMFWVIGFIVLAAGIFFIIGASSIDEPSGPGYYLAGVYGVFGLIGIAAGLILVSIGVILFVVGKNRESEKALDEHDSQSKSKQ